MKNNRTLVYGNLYGIPNTWERKYKQDSNTHSVIVNNESVTLKENFNTYLLQTDIKVEGSYLEYFIFPTNDSRKKIRDILNEEQLALGSKGFYFDVRIETFRNPPYLHFKNAIVVDDVVDECDLYTSTIECEVFKHNLSGEDDIYNFMLVKTINDEGYNNPLKIHYKNPQVAKLTGYQKINVKVENLKLVMVE
jgi:hypothetical protein